MTRTEHGNHTVPNNRPAITEHTNGLPQKLLLALLLFNLYIYETSTFHLNNEMASAQVEVQLADTTLNHNIYPKSKTPVDHRYKDSNPK